MLSYVHEQVTANAEIVVAFTDFRMDDLDHNGNGTGPINDPVSGIGQFAVNPSAGASYGSTTLLTSMQTVFLDQPNFEPTGVTEGRQYRAFSPGVRWIAHEAVHRWGAGLGFRHPLTGEAEDLLDDFCHCHWRDYLHAPAMHPAGPGFSDVPYTEASIMGGDVWVANGDGTFTRTDNSHPLPTGLSALDLYAMGMISASEVPDTFILRDVQRTDRWDTVRATKVPVRIQDIVAAMGPRVPAAESSRRDFRLAVYLLHEDGRPPRADLMERARGISLAVSDYFDRATGGRMRVIPLAGTLRAGMGSSVDETRSRGIRSSFVRPRVVGLQGCDHPASVHRHGLGRLP